jgi:hypothetical protein
MSQGYILCHAQGGINDIACQVWYCTDYANKHNREIILTNWSYFGSDLFDVFDFSNYPVKIHPIDHLNNITYDNVEPPECEDYVKLFLDKKKNLSIIDSLFYRNPEDIHKRIFIKTCSYSDSTLLLHESFGGGLWSMHFFENVGFTEKFQTFFKEKTANFPMEYNSIHIRHTDMKVDSDILVKNIHLFDDSPLFIGTDDPILKKSILDKFENAFSTEFKDMPTINLHYLKNKEILENALVDLFVMVFSKNKIEDFYKKTEVNITSGFCKLIDALKDMKNDIRIKLDLLL